jgi:hypothetical protein
MLSEAKRKAWESTGRILVESTISYLYYRQQNTSERQTEVKQSQLYTQLSPSGRRVLPIEAGTTLQRVPQSIAKYIAIGGLLYPRHMFYHELEV